MTIPVVTITGKHTETSAVVKAFNIDDGMLVTKVPTPPENLDDEGILWWNYYCRIFVDGKILSRMFLTSMHNLCIMHMLRSNYMDALANGIFIEQWIMGKDKEPELVLKTNPIVKELRSCLIEMDRLLASLGMTAYTSKVNNIDTTGAIKKAKGGAGPPSVTFVPPPKQGTP